MTRYSACWVRQWSTSSRRRLFSANGGRSSKSALPHVVASKIVEMDPTQYTVVAEFINDGEREMRIFLEMTCEEVFVAVGQKVQLLARPADGLLPITVAYLQDGLQVFPHQEFDPDWHIRFNGVLMKPGYPTRLSDVEAVVGLPSLPDA